MNKIKESIIYKYSIIYYIYKKIAIFYFVNNIKKKKKTINVISYTIIQRKFFYIMLN